MDGLRVRPKRLSVATSRRRRRGRRRWQRCRRRMRRRRVAANLGGLAQRGPVGVGGEQPGDRLGSRRDRLRGRRTSKSVWRRRHGRGRRQWRRWRRWHVAEGLGGPAQRLSGAGERLKVSTGDAGSDRLFVGAQSAGPQAGLTLGRALCLLGLPVGLELLDRGGVPLGEPAVERLDDLGLCRLWPNPLADVRDWSRRRASRRRATPTPRS